jgi:hypothetical protein
MRPGTGPAPADDLAVIADRRRVASLARWPRARHPPECSEVAHLPYDAGAVRWLSAQTHSGENIDETPTHALFVELKESGRSAGAATLGPSS